MLRFASTRRTLLASGVAAAQAAASPDRIPRQRGYSTAESGEAAPLRSEHPHHDRLLRPVELPSDAQMLRPRDAFFGYLAHSERLEVCFPVARGEATTVPSPADELNAPSLGVLSSSPTMGIVAEPAGIEGPPMRPRRRPRQLFSKGGTSSQRRRSSSCVSGHRGVDDSGTTSATAQDDRLVAKETE